MRERFKEGIQITAPELRMPDPEVQFIVKVDASVEEVGTVLSQRGGNDQSIRLFLSQADPSGESLLCGR